MAAKEFLNEGYRARELIASYKAEIDSLMGVLKAAPLTERVQSSPTGDNVARLVEEIKSYKERLVDEYLYLLHAQEEISYVIGLVKDKDERLLLRLRYVNYYSWDDIANEMGYSERHTQRLHQKALLSTEIVLNSLSFK